jgi:hypothetical protein
MDVRGAARTVALQFPPLRRLYDHARFLQDRAKSLEDDARSLQHRTTSLEDHVRSLEDRAASLQKDGWPRSCFPRLTSSARGTLCGSMAVLAAALLATSTIPCFAASACTLQRST